LVSLPPTAPTHPYTLSLHDALPISHLDPILRFDPTGQGDKIEQFVDKAARREPLSANEIEVLRAVATRWSEPWTREGKIVLARRSEEHTSELQSRFDLVCRLLLEKK